MNAPLIEKRRGPAPGTGSPKVAMATAVGAWPAPLPGWVGVLAQACDRTSQSMVAKRLDYSPSVISAVLNHSYKGNYDAIEKTVRGIFLAETLECPVLGAIGTHLCLHHQKRAVKFQPSSSMRVTLYRACRGGCMHSRLAPIFEESSDAEP